MSKPTISIIIEIDLPDFEDCDHAPMIYGAVLMVEAEVTPIQIPCDLFTSRSFILDFDQAVLEISSMSLFGTDQDGGDHDLGEYEPKTEAELRRIERKCRAEAERIHLKQGR